MDQAGARPDHASPVGIVAERLGSDSERGLGEERAAELLESFGPNELDSGAEPQPGKILVDQLTSPMILMLVGAGMLSAALGDITEAVVILVVVALNAWIGFRQEYRAERAIASLQAMATPAAEVVRGGRSREVPVRELVPGDLVRLESGSMVPADGRLVEAHALRIEESALTGESAPSDKAIDPVDAGVELAESEFDGLLGHERRRRTRQHDRDRDRDASGARPRRRAAAGRRGRQDTTAAASRLAGSPARPGGGRDRP